MTIVVILGKRLNNDGSMTKDLLNRLKLGLKTYNEVKPDYLCLCGGAPNLKAGLTEASQMYEYCLNNNISEDNIICEDESLTTYENAKNLKEILIDVHVDKLYLVSSKKHFTRIIYPKAHILFKEFFNEAEIIKVFE